MISLALGAILAALAVLLTALPFIQHADDLDAPLDGPTPEQERRIAVIEERDRALAALKELEFDHRTGKIDDTDYRELVGPLRRTAAEALRIIDEGSAKE
ncbi:MAG: hypothetical protein F2663_05220 [Actinobacteria bacterium]|uniref:Unannotated protein n=1 Tax=freshwater metagenome TaxID=449393 RepID=A0A6J6PIU1_9ZZZZ|nr:hypothetical protein [Actinomycetota bacterium]